MTTAGMSLPPTCPLSSSCPAFAAVVEPLTRDASDLVRDAARWALERLGGTPPEFSL